MASLKLNKHDLYVMKLCRELAPYYDSIRTHVPLVSLRTKRSIGEIDIVAKRGDKFDIYEVKCSYRIHKAKKQLKKFRKILNMEDKRGKNFFYCGITGIIEMVTA